MTCPCKYLEEPCDPRCSCIDPFSSYGCKYCCTYGSDEQKENQAKYIKKAIDTYQQREKKLKRILKK